MGGNAAHERRGELDDVVVCKEQVNGLIAGEMTAFEQDRDAVFRLASSVPARRMISSRAIGFAENFAASVEVGRDQGRERK